MALVTVHRSPSPICEHQQNSTQDASSVDGDGDNTLKPLSRNQSFSESYLTVKGAALILPQTECSRTRSCEPGKGDIQVHLQLMLYLLRVRDKLKLAVKLENKNVSTNIISTNSTADEQLDPSSSSSSSPTGSVHSRYMVLVSSHLEWPTSGREPAVESDVILGIDILDTKATIGLVLPVRGDVSLCLDGDGGFNVSTDGRLHNFKPVSVQAMWAALQSLIKARDSALPNAHLPLATLEGWINYYSTKIKSEASFICEWHATLDSCSKDEGFLSLGSSAQRPVNAQLEKTIRTKLKQVMMTVDLEEVTSKYLREKLEEDLGTSLYTWKRFIDDEMIIIMRQMDAPSEIFPYLYLGSEWNASNLEELQNNKVGYILNVTREIANFYPETFEYHNVRIFDEEDSDLLKHWENTHKFISRARDNDSKVLVHCKMGVSRSASTVIAFVMKEMKMSLQEAMKHVRSKRSCIQPNKGFRKQLEIYEGILDASKQRHSRLWQSSSSVDLQETLNSSQGTSRPLGMGSKFSPGSNSSSSSSPTSSTVSCDQLRTNEMEASQMRVSSSSEKNVRSERATKSHDRKRTHHTSTSSDETNVFESGHLHPTRSSSSRYPFSRENKFNCVLAKAKSFLSVFESSQNSKRVPSDGKPSFYSRSRSVSPKSRTPPRDDFRVSASDERAQSPPFSETATGGRPPKKQESFSLRVRPDNFWIRDEPLDSSDAGHNLRETSRSPNKMEVFHGSERSLLADLTPGKVKRTKHEIENRERIMSTSTVSSRRQGKNAGERLSVSPSIHRSSSFKMERSKTKEFLGEKRKTYPLSKNQEDRGERTVDETDGHESAYSRPKPPRQDDRARLRKHSRSTVDVRSSVRDGGELSGSEDRRDREIRKGEASKARKGFEDATLRKADVGGQKILPTSKCPPFGTSSGCESRKAVRPSPGCKRSLDFNETTATDDSSGNDVDCNVVHKGSATPDRHSSARLNADSDPRRESCKGSGTDDSRVESQKASSVPSSEASEALRKRPGVESQIAGDKMRSEVNNCSKSVSSLYLELHHEASVTQEEGANCRNLGQQNDSSGKICPQKDDGTSNDHPHLKVTENLVFPTETSLGSKAFQAVCQKSMNKVKSPVIFMPSAEPVFSTVPCPEAKPARRPRDLGVVNLSISKSSGDLARVGSEEISKGTKATSDFVEESSNLSICSAVTPLKRSICNFSIASADLSSAKSITPVLCKSVAKEDLLGKDRNRPTSCSKPPTPTYHADQSLLCN